MNRNLYPFKNWVASSGAHLNICMTFHFLFRSSSTTILRQGNSLGSTESYAPMSVKNERFFYLKSLGNDLK